MTPYKTNCVNTRLAISSLVYKISRVTWQIWIEISFLIKSKINVGVQVCQSTGDVTLLSKDDTIFWQYQVKMTPYCGILYYHYWMAVLNDVTHCRNTTEWCDTLSWQYWMTWHIVVTLLNDVTHRRGSTEWCDTLSWQHLVTVTRCCGNT